MSCDRDTVCYLHSILFNYSYGMKYQYGIVAYLNGIEVYRDNMPDGQPSACTLTSDSYSSCDYHGECCVLMYVRILGRRQTNTNMNF